MKRQTHISIFFRTFTIGIVKRFSLAGKTFKQASGKHTNLEKAILETDDLLRCNYLLGGMHSYA